MNDKKDFYDVLGVDKSASDQEIKRAYKKLAKKYHPDIYKGSDGDVKFKELAEAYEILSDPQKRSAYDQYGHAGVDNAGGPGGFGGFQDFDFGDIFGDIFGGGAARRNPNAPQAGEDIETQISISFEESYLGTKKNVTYQVVDDCKTCSGTGARPGSDVKTCQKCQGQGTYHVQQQSLFGTSIREVVCEVCHGSGKEIVDKCLDCRGEGKKSRKVTLEINIPSGIEHGQHLQIPGKGNVGKNNGPHGNLYILILVAENKNFQRNGLNIYTKTPISFTQAALGGVIEVNLVNEKIELSIPEGTQTGTNFKVRNKGFKRDNSQGDVYVEVEVVTPHNLTKQQKEVLAQLDTEFSHKNYKKSSWWNWFK